jgi:hypothetical protein
MCDIPKFIQSSLRRGVEVDSQLAFYSGSYSDMSIATRASCGFGGVVEGETKVSKLSYST